MCAGKGFAAAEKRKCAAGGDEGRRRRGRGWARGVAVALAAALLAAPLAVAAGADDPWRALAAGLDAVCAGREEVLVTSAKLQGGSVRLYRDPASGTVQIVAETEADLLFGQGYAHAKDRLFQLEILRRLALGEISALVGEKAVAIDKWNRAMGYRQLGAGDHRLLSDPVQAGLEAYCHGINAYLSKRSLFLNMPADLLVLGAHPRPFTPGDILAFIRWHSSSMNKGWQNEFVFEKLHAALGEEIVRALSDGLRYDSDSIAGGMSATLHKPHEFNRRRGASLRFPETLAHPLSALVPGSSENGGSNAWVISGNLTASGKPIIANDPHLPFSLPAAWHSIRLTAPRLGVDQMGLSCPLIPYIVAGTNTHTANGVTLGRCDVDDVFLEKVRVRPDGVRVYLDADGSEKPLAARVESIEVKGRDAPVKFTVYETPRGPLVCRILGLAAEGTDCSLASLALQKPAEMLAGFGRRHSLNTLRQLTYARTFDQFRAAAEDAVTCNLNMVFAAANGDIGYQMTGRVPNRTDIGEAPREGWNSAHQWNGWVPFNAMPTALNPERGYIVSANQKPYLDGADPPEFLGNVWQHGWRGRRVEELIRAATAGGGKVTPGNSRAWQRDLVSIPGRTFADYARDGLFDGVRGASGSARIGEMVSVVRAWDGGMRVDSSAAAIFAAFKEEILREVLRGFVPSNQFADEILGVGMIQAGKLGNDLEGRQSAFALRILRNDSFVHTLLAAGNKTLPGVVESAWEKTYERLSSFTKREDPATWRWGEMHRSSFVHPLGKAGAPLDKMFNVEAGEVPGDADTVSLAAYLHQSEARPGLPMPAQPFQQRGFAASSRWVADLLGGAATDTHIVVAPGNSGRQSSPHYDDMKDLLTNSVSAGINHLTRPSYGAERELVTEIVRA
ncbi:Penicillin acylase 2 [Diplonema papillatum]|nr:Penicillin acylase 2 [Diplonema papillatum]|eukprot:gene17599-27094_t